MYEKQEFKMNRDFLESVREYLEACYKYHHANEEIKHNLTHDYPYYDLVDIKDGNLTWSSGLCRESSYVLKSMLKKAFNENWSIAGGFALKKDVDARKYVKKSLHKQIMESDKATPLFGGAIIVTNDFKVYGSHWWLERSDTILDLSADQFGHESVIITKSDDPIYRKEASMSNMEALKSVRKEALIWTKNEFDKQPENKETSNAIAAFSKLMKHPDFNRAASLEL